LFFFSLHPRPPLPTLFPYTTLFRSQRARLLDDDLLSGLLVELVRVLSLGELQRGGLLDAVDELVVVEVRLVGGLGEQLAGDGLRDRKSTRLNSSHVKISYAVFCLKK